MKKFTPTMLLLLALFTVAFANAQGPKALAIEASVYYSDVIPNNIENRAIQALDPNGFKYDFENLNINTPYSEHATAFFRDKVIVSSSKRIGGFSKAITIFSNAKTERKMIKIKGYVERISMPEKKKSMLSEDN